MDERLTPEELDFLLEALRYMRWRIENTAYPAEETQGIRLELADRVAEKVRTMREAAPG